MSPKTIGWVFAGIIALKCLAVVIILLVSLLSFKELFSMENNIAAQVVAILLAFGGFIMTCFISVIASKIMARVNKITPIIKQPLPVKNSEG